MKKREIDFHSLYTLIRLVHKNCLNIRAYINPKRFELMSALFYISTSAFGSDVSHPVCFHNLVVLIEDVIFIPWWISVKKVAPFDSNFSSAVEGLVQAS